MSTARSSWLLSDGAFCNTAVEKSDLSVVVAVSPAWPATPPAPFASRQPPALSSSAAVVFVSVTSAHTSVVAPMMSAEPDVPAPRLAFTPSPALLQSAPNSKPLSSASIVVDAESSTTYRYHFPFTDCTISYSTFMMSTVGPSGISVSVAE